MPGYGILNAHSGEGLLPWSWATERLATARTYWFATTQPDGQPHVMPIWGVWLNDTFCFSTGQQSRKARNLLANPSCSVGVEAGDDAISVQGTACEMHDPTVRQQFVDAYSTKYQWDMDGFGEPAYLMRPSVAFAFRAGADAFVGSATRWVFVHDRSRPPNAQTDLL
jgi:hypothetical protein